jgi:hypothetical protein
LGKVVGEGNFLPEDVNVNMFWNDIGF